MRKNETLDLVYIALFAVLIAVCSWLVVPMTVPFTMQTFAVFLTLSLLGGKRGCFAVAVYLLMGAIGLPVFAGGNAGLGTLLGT
ncbi:MAG: biotin transporter BioY, partial [Oscillospiraceae bacterium]